MKCFFIYWVGIISSKKLISFKTIAITKMNTSVNEMREMIDNVNVENCDKKKIEISFQIENEAQLQTTTMSSMNEMNTSEKIETKTKTKKTKKPTDPNKPKKTKKTKLVFEDDDVVMPEPTTEPVVSATMEMPRSFHIDDAVFSDEDGAMEVREIIVPEPEPSRKWICGLCERGGNYCDDECRHCRNELCRLCCNSRSVDLDDEPLVVECGTCGHYECQCDMEMPEVSYDNIINVPQPVMCAFPHAIGGYTYEVAEDECASCGYVGLDGVMVCPDCGALPVDDDGNEIQQPEPKVPYHMTHQVGDLQCAGCGYQFNNIDEAMSCPSCNARGSTYDIPEPPNDEDTEPTDDEDDGCRYCRTIRQNPNGEYDPPPVNGRCYLCAEQTDDNDTVSETEEISHDGCPVCFEPTEYTTVDCGHKLCAECHTHMTEVTHNYSCPICRQRMVLGVRLPMTDAEKLADYDRLFAENRRLKAENDRLAPIARRNERHAERRARRVNAEPVAQPVQRPPRQPRPPRPPRQPRFVLNDEDRETARARQAEIAAERGFNDVIPLEVIANTDNGFTNLVPAPSRVVVRLEDGQVLGDVDFNSRPRLKCCINGCARRTRRVCDGCRNIRVCEQHQRCPDCRDA